MYLDILYSLPRLRLSRAQMRMILFVMKQTGSRDVPSLKELIKFRKKLQDRCGAPSIEQKSELGNVYFVNDVRATFAMVRRSFLSRCICS